MLGGPEMTIILVIVLVLFGGAQLPKLARNLGRAQKEFRDGLAEAAADDRPPAADTTTPDARADDAARPD